MNLLNQVRKPFFGGHILPCRIAALCTVWTVMLVQCVYFVLYTQTSFSNCTLFTVSATSSCTFWNVQELALQLQHSALPKRQAGLMFLGETSPIFRGVPNPEVCGTFHTSLCFARGPWRKNPRILYRTVLLTIWLTMKLNFNFLVKLCRYNWTWFISSKYEKAMSDEIGVYYTNVQHI